MAATTTTTTPSLGDGADDRLLATAQQIVRSLNTPKEVREDMLLIFSSFDNRLSSITDLINGEDSKSSAAEEDLDRFQAAEKVILRWDSSGSGAASRQSNSLLHCRDDVIEYLSAVDDIVHWIEQISIAPSCKETQILIDRADNAIQLAMSRLEDELRHALIRNTVPLDADRLYGSIRRDSLSFSSNYGGLGENFESFDEVNDCDSARFHERGASLADDVFVDLINPEGVEELKEIADRMLKSGYDRECLQIYSNIRRDALDECLAILGVERLSIEEVQRIQWDLLDEKMKKWIYAVKIVVRVLLSGEKKLCDCIFEEYSDVCFNETAKGCIMQLLNFGEAVAIIRRAPEKLFRILDMYEALGDVFPDLEALISDEFVIIEAKGLLTVLGEAAKGSFAEFENAVRNETSKRPVLTGGLHPMPRYVMNYMKLLMDYGDSLDSLLEVSEEDLDRFQKNHGGDSSQLETMSPLHQRMLFSMSELEFNLQEKSRIYEDSAMQYIFLMNNIYYIVKKVKDSDLRNVLGDDWVRKRRGQIRQYATAYLRASWTKALTCLKDEGIGGSSSNASKNALKERFKNFNACFEDIYRVQTAWKVPDAQLREELRISISEKVIPAYRSFVGRFSSQLDGRHAGKYIKYTAEDLESYLLNLFEGEPKVLHNVRRKST
ncbi:exocyst complex component EXO70B1 [Prosopis cineraria]|uniref:exocyst complex component EXO70B1 n=1 Tax=Prosopis cineraria TaxID=364024 RepID=UPI002410AAB4|nr:exocyst complex component EXO70B1 [Prosopis cineraria]